MYDTAFTLSLLRGLVTVAVVAGTAWPVAGFFHEPRLAPVLLALGLASLLAAVENVRTADLVRDLQFRREFQLWTLPRVVQVAATVGVALLLRSYWALVFGVVFGRALRTALSYLMIPYRPRLTLVAWRPILGFTTWSWAVWIATVARDRVDTFLVGRIFAPAAVGVFSLGAEIAHLPTTELIEPLSRACFPSFAQLRNRGLSVGAAYVRLLGAAAAVVLPAGLGVAAVADPLVRLAFGPNWLDAIGVIRVLGVAATLGVVGTLSGTLLSAFGLLRVNFSLVVAASAVRAAGLALFLPGGTLATAAAVVAAATVAEQLAFLLLTARRFGVRLRELGAALSRTVLATAAMVGVLTVTGLGFSPAAEDPAGRLAACAALGAACYVAVLGLLWLAAGRPDGPERDMLSLWERVSGRLAGLARRRRPPARP